MMIYVPLYIYFVRSYSLCCDCQFFRQKVSSLSRAFLFSPKPPNLGVSCHSIRGDKLNIEHSILSHISPYSSWLWLSLRFCSRLTPQFAPRSTLYSGPGQGSGQPGFSASLTTPRCASSVWVPSVSDRSGGAGPGFDGFFIIIVKQRPSRNWENLNFSSYIFPDKSFFFFHSFFCNHSNIFFAKECDLIIRDHWDHWPQKRA